MNFILQISCLFWSCVTCTIYSANQLNYFSSPSISVQKSFSNTNLIECGRKCLKNACDKFEHEGNITFMYNQG